MYGSPYGSYSGMSSPMDIHPSHNYSRPQDASCAFPSWSRYEQEHQQRATSYLSDEDLLSDFGSEASSAGYHSDSRSNSNSSTPRQHQQPVSEADMLEMRREMRREQAAYQEEVIRLMALEKERRRNAARKAKSCRSGSTSSKKGSPKSKRAAMTPIAEAE